MAGKNISVYSLLSESPEMPETPPKHNVTSFYDPITNTTRETSASTTASSPKASENNTKEAKKDVQSPHRMRMSLSEIMNNDKGSESHENKIIIGGMVIPQASGTPKAAKEKEDTKVETKVDSTPKNTSVKAFVAKPPQSAGSANSTPKAKKSRHTESPRRRRTGQLTRGIIGAGMDGSEMEPEEDLEGAGDAAGATKQPQLPIISVDVPVAHPGAKMQEAQVTFNVTSLCEDKYGFNALNPGHRIVLDLGEDEADDEMEGEEETGGATAGSGSGVSANAPPPPPPEQEDPDSDDIAKQLKLKFEPGMTDEDKEEMVLKELHRRRMEDNKRIGKYDTEDPFIDDDELQFEEQTKSNKDGFFVYYGKWVEPERKRGNRAVSSNNGSGGSNNSSNNNRRRPQNNNINSGNSNNNNNNKRRKVSPQAPVRVASNEVKEQPKVLSNENTPKSKESSVSSETSTSKKSSADKPEIVVGGKPVIASSASSNNKIIIGSFKM